METRRPVMGTPTAIGAALAFLIATIAIAKIFDSPLSVIIIAILVLIAYGVVRHNSR